MYYTNFKGKACDLYNDTKQIIRRFRVSDEIVNAQVTGSGNNAKVAITMRNGKTVVYKANGQMLRR